MVNLEKLVDCKETGNFGLGASDSLITNKNNEETSPKQQLVDEFDSQKESPNSQSPLNLPSELEENEKFNSEDCALSDINETDLKKLINNEETENLIGLQINNKKENEVELNEDSNISEFNEASDNQHNLPQLGNNLNGIKKESDNFYFLDLKWPNSSQLNFIFDQLRTMYIQQQLLDCTLVCENQYIKAHKLMLATVSSYFRSIFDSFNNLGCNNAAVIVDIPATDMRLIIKILYSIDDCNPIKISLSRAISLRKSVYRLKIDFIDNKLDQYGIPQLNSETSSLNQIVELKSRKRKHSFYDDDDDVGNNLESNNRSLIDNHLKNNQNDNNQSSSESADEVDSECSVTMKHHKYKHRYLLSNEHLEKSKKLIRCGNDMLADQQSLEEEILENEKEHYDQQTNEDEEKVEAESNISSNHLNHHKSSIREDDENDDQKFSEKNHEDLQASSSNLNSSVDIQSHQQNKQNQNINDFSFNKLSNSDEILKLMNNSINNNESVDKVANIYKAMKKIWATNTELMNNDSFNQIYKPQNNLANDFLNNTFSQLCMANSNLNNNLNSLGNLNSDAARTLLLTNELLKNNTNNNHLSHSKNSGDNSLNTSTSSTNSSSNNGLNNQKNSSATAALVAAAQQHILNANFLNNKNSNSLNKSNNSLVNNPKSNNNLSSSSNNYSSMQNSSSGSSYNKSSNSSTIPVKRGRGRPPRHTQSASSSSETGSLTDDNQLNKSQQSKLNQSIKQQLTSTTSSLNNISSSLNNLNSLSNTTNSIATSLNALSQHKKWRPNLENLLSLKMGKNKLSTSSPTNELTSLTNPTQNNLIKNDLRKSLSSNNSSNISNHYSQNGSLSSLTSNKTNSTNTVNGTSNNSSDNKNSTQNICPYCPQIYYSTQAMNDHINNVHTKTAFKYICEFCSKEFSWKISLTKHLKHAHSELNNFGSRSISNLNVSNLNGLTSAINNHLNAANSLSNQELLHSIMNRDNETMLNFGAMDYEIKN